MTIPHSIRRSVIGLCGLILMACGGAQSSTDDPPRAAHAQPPAEPDTAHAGDSAATRVTLTDAAMHTAEIRVVEAAAIDAQHAEGALDVPGQVDFDPHRVAVLSPRAAGRIERLLVAEGDRVRAGETVALIQSPAYFAAQAEYAQALRRAVVLKGTTDAAGADAIVNAAARRLRLLGVSEADLSRIAAGGEPNLYLPLLAPFAGSIIEGSVLPGAVVDAGSPVFKLADLSVVDVVAEVPERLLPHVRIGQAATVTIAAYPTMLFAGAVERLRDVLNAETRTVRAIIHVTNPGHNLRPGMFANVRLHTRGPIGVPAATSGVTVGVTVPESAIITDGGERYLFVEVVPRTFERRHIRVTTSPASVPVSAMSSARETSVIVVDGVRAGERVVARGAFTLKSELAKAAFAEED